jgi:hypothetical protein
MIVWLPTDESLTRDQVGSSFSTHFFLSHAHGSGARQPAPCCAPGLRERYGSNRPRLEVGCDQTEYAATRIRRNISPSRLNRICRHADQWNTVCHHLDPMECAIITTKRNIPLSGPDRICNYPDQTENILWRTDLDGKFRMNPRSLLPSGVKGYRPA